MLGKYLVHLPGQDENETIVCALKYQKELNNIYQAVYSRAVANISLIALDTCTVNVEKNVT